MSKASREPKRGARGADAPRRAPRVTPDLPYNPFIPRTESTGFSHELAPKSLPESFPSVYRQPSAEVVQLLDAPRTPRVKWSPDGRSLALLEHYVNVPIADMARPEIRVAGLRIKVESLAPTLEKYYKRISVMSLPDGVARFVTGIPNTDYLIRCVTWSPDSEHLAFVIHAENSSEVWVVNRSTAYARCISDVRIRDSGGADGSLLKLTFSHVFSDKSKTRGLIWLPGSQSILCKVMHPHRESPPSMPSSPHGPQIKMNQMGVRSPAVTYQDLLRTKHDAVLFKYYCSSIVAILGLDGTCTFLDSSMATDVAALASKLTTMTPVSETDRFHLGPVPAAGTSARLTRVSEAHSSLTDVPDIEPIPSVNMEFPRSLSLPVPLPAAQIFHSLSLSPSGKTLLVDTVHAPFSFLVPWPRFPRRFELWNLPKSTAATTASTMEYLCTDMQVDKLLLIAPSVYMQRVRVRLLVDRPLDEGHRNIIKPGGEITFWSFPRSFSWHPYHPCTLCWVEARDGGQASIQPPPMPLVLPLPQIDAPSLTPMTLRPRDLIFVLDTEILWANSTAKSSRIVCALEWRYSNMLWLSRPNSENLKNSSEHPNPQCRDPKSYEFDYLLVVETWKPSKRMRTWLVKVPSHMENLDNLAQLEAMNVPGAPVSVPERRPILHRSSQDKSADRGSPFLQTLSSGHQVAMTRLMSSNIVALFPYEGSDQLFSSTSSTSQFVMLLAGSTLTKQGARPFVDVLSVDTLSMHRIWQSAPSFYDRPLTFLDGDMLLIRRESPVLPPNFYLCSLRDHTSAALTDIKHPAPHLQGVRREVLAYTRSDGTKLSGSLYLPARWDESCGQLPTLLWVYPREYQNRHYAEQRHPSAFRFINISKNPIIWAAVGFAVLVNPTLPIIPGRTVPGQGSPFKEETKLTAGDEVELIRQIRNREKEHLATFARAMTGSESSDISEQDQILGALMKPKEARDRTTLAKDRSIREKPISRYANDTFIEQLVAGAEAAHNELVRRRICYPQSLVIAGHSYGAFTAANLLAHAPHLFAAGIARSGAFNRTLTPFGFQTETRTFWAAPDVYLRMSPFVHANKIQRPILLIHGEADENYGTFTEQSRRFYDALKGQGAEVRYVELPFESHHYRARESQLHVLWETERWLILYSNRKSKMPIPKSSLIVSNNILSIIPLRGPRLAFKSDCGRANLRSSLKILAVHSPFAF